MPKLTYWLSVLTIIICNSCSVRKTSCYSANEQYLILENPTFGPKCKIYLPVQTLINEFAGKPDCTVLIEYLKKSKANLEVNTIHFNTETGWPSDTDLILLDFWDSKLEYLLKNGFVLIYNTKHNEWVKKYYIRHYETPFGGSGISVQDSNGEELYNLIIGIG